MGDRQGRFRRRVCQRQGRLGEWVHVKVYLRRLADTHAHPSVEKCTYHIGLSNPMNNTSPDNEPKMRLRALYPHLNEDEFKEAEENLRCYLAHAVRVYNRICSDVTAHKKLKTLLRKKRMLR